MCMTIKIYKDAIPNQTKVIQMYLHVLPNAKHTKTKVKASTMYNN